MELLKFKFIIQISAISWPSVKFSAHPSKLSVNFEDFRSRLSIKKRVGHFSVDTVTILPNSQLSVKPHLAPLTSYTSFVSFIQLIFIYLKNLLFSLLSQDPHGHHFE